MYVADIILKSKKVETLPQDMREIFVKIRQVGMKLNPKKCVFRIATCKCLGFMVSERGIEADLKKIWAIKDMPPPRNIQDVKRLTGCMAYLGTILSSYRRKKPPFLPTFERKCDTSVSACFGAAQKMY